MNQVQNSQQIHIEFLLEEHSAEAALMNIVPKILGPTVSLRFHPYSGKRDLLDKLPWRLKAYSRWLPTNWRIVVLVDRDQEDCEWLKAKLEQNAQDASLPTKSSPWPSPRIVLNRLAIEELEAWFFGDVDALIRAYPRLGRNIAAKARYRDPDAIGGGTWEALEKELKQAGYYQGGLAKIKLARDVSTYMDPDRNRSRSFQVFRKGLLELVRQ